MLKSFVISLIVILLFGCSPKNNEFELCGFGFKSPYYYPELKYEGDFYVIKQHFLVDYKDKIETGFNGIVKVRFQVNCKGEAGNYHLETYSLNYKDISNENKTSLFFLKKTKQLQAWIPGKDDGGDQVNSHKFLSFRIVDGDLKEILPK